MAFAVDSRLSGKRVYLAGHTGMAGSAIARRLRSEDCEVLTASSQSVDLRRQNETEELIAALKPHYVILAAGRVGGILANDTCPVDFIADNLSIALNVISASYLNRVERLLYLGSTCAYPRLAPQPTKEEDLMTGPLEPTNQWYAVAKIAGIKLCQAYRKQHAADYVAVMPTNLYGPGDNYHPEHSHVVAALVRRFHEAKQKGADSVVVWGSGQPRREFLYVDDFADACIFVLNRFTEGSLINIGLNQDISIAELGAVIADVVGFKGQMVFDTSKPDGTPRKLVDVSRLSALGWKASTKLKDGLTAMYDDFRSRQVRGV